MKRVIAAVLLAAACVAGSTSGVGTAAFLGLRRVDAIAAHIRHASTSGGGLENLIARRVDLGGHGRNNRWN